jgi:hypothetical protein
MLTLAHDDAKRAGEVACSFATTATDGDWRLGLAYTVIAATKASCHAAIVRRLDTACSEHMDCADETWGTSHLCTPTDTRSSVEGWLASITMKDGLRQPGPSALSLDSAWLAATYASEKTLPRSVVLRNARRKYTVATPAARCDDRAARGTPCACDTSETLLCNLPLDGKSFEQGRCSVRANDRDKVVSATHVCSGAREACADDTDCCAGLRCSEAGSGGCAP